jgi:ADP-sugar diphosphatase
VHVFVKLSVFSQYQEAHNAMSTEEKQAVRQIFQDICKGGELNKQELINSLQEVSPDVPKEDIEFIVKSLIPGKASVKSDEFVDFMLARTVQIGTQKVMVTAEHDGLDIQKALDSKPFKQWVASISKDPKFVISKIVIQSIDLFGPRVGFIKFKADAKVDGKMVPGIVFMRGGAVAVLVILKHGQKTYTLVVKQPRVAVCDSAFVEIPAGMLDGDGNFAGVAAKEMKEETGIELKQSDLIDMTEMTYGNRVPGMFPSCGGCDEFNRIFLFRKNVTEAELKDLQGRLTGVVEEGEMIKLQVIPFDDLWHTSCDAKALAAVCLHDRLLASGKIAPF